MEVLYDNDIENKEKVVYLVTCCVGSHYKEYHYIGETKRPLKRRIYEHLTSKKSAVYKFLQNNDVKCMRVEVLRECEFEQQLDSAETVELCKYIVKRGFRNNQKNRLINILWKGLDKYTLNEVKKCQTTLSPQM